MFDFARAFFLPVPRPVNSSNFYSSLSPVRDIGRRTAVLLLAALSVACLYAPRAYAQTSHFSSAIKPLGSGFSYPYGMTVDSAGDVFIADCGSGTVKELVAVNGAIPTDPTIRTFGKGFFEGVFALAVDGAGNIFVADQAVSPGHGTVKEILAVHGSIPDTPEIITVASGFNEPFGVAVDATGNVFVADGSSTNNGTVEMIVAVNGSIPPNPAIKTLGSGFWCPSAVAVDAAGNVFVADYHKNVVQEIVAVNGVVPDNPTINTLAGGFYYPSAIAVDSSGNVFVTDRQNGAVKKIVAVGGSIPSNPTILTLANQSPDELWGGALDGAGNIYFTDIATMAVEEIEVGRVDFSKVNLGGPSETIPVTFTFDSAGTLGGSRVLPGVPPVGQTALEFSVPAPGSNTSALCVASASYNAGDTCTVNMKFSPLYPGQRTGSVQLLNTSGNVIATALLKGIGVGPQIAFTGNRTATVLAGGFRYGAIVAVDAAGDVFVGDYWNLKVVEIPVGCAGTGCQITLPDAHLPLDMFVDGSGNVFVVENDNVVTKTPWTGSSYGTMSTISCAGGCVTGTIDASGNLYTVDIDGTISRMTWTGSGYGPAVTVASGLGYWPDRLAVDLAGNIFVAVGRSSLVKAIVAENGTIPANPTILTVGSGFNSPSGVALDAAGDLIVADSGHGSVKEIVASNGVIPANPTIVTLLAGLSVPWQAVADGAGDIYLNDGANNATTIKKLSLSGPRYSTFAPYEFQTATAMGTTDAIDAPLLVVIANNGNADLHLPGPLSGFNPSVSPNFAWDNQSTCAQTSPSSQAPFTLAPGASCTLALDFAPVFSTVAGSVQGQATLTDDSLNASSPGYLTQSIGLTGTAIFATTTTASNAAATYQPTSQSVTLSVNVSSPSAVVNEGVVAIAVFNGSIQLCSASSGTVTAGVASASCMLPSGTSAGTYSLYASYNDPGGSFASSDDSSGSLSVGKATAAVTLAGLTQTYTGSPLAVTATAAPAGLKVAITYNGNSNAPTIAGSYAIAASVNDSNYQGTAAGTLVIAKAGSNTVLSLSAPSITPGQSVTLTAQVKSVSTGTPAGTVSFYDNGTLLNTAAIAAGSASYATAALSPGTTHTISATYNGDTNFNTSTASSTATTITVAPLDFTMTSQDASNLTVAPGGSVSYKMTLTPMYGSYAGTVSFAVSGLPPGATSTVSPSTIAANGGPQTVTITIGTAPLTAAKNSSTAGTASRMAPFALAMLLLVGAGRLRRRARALSRMLSVWMLAAAIFTALAGCGGANGFFNKAPQNYTVTTTALAGTLQHSTTFTLNLQ
jgi:hypothetical protein